MPSVCRAFTQGTGALPETHPAFSPKTYGHSGLLDMLRTDDLLALQQESGGHWTVRLRSKVEGEVV
ncbi:hypothetical protein C7444_108146 [Sphaerotilus hippei]|uniref:Uncharacterized protein n=1 Tax=Sphaerotilus hippei TaxID=744406 RepID=A0A318H801_9BURK|nr:hypothetical protein [Sphaerotilus hippei]PXW95887.1 hypothetical protein C7444_108146 [Sphaerotilus hippei]